MRNFKLVAPLIIAAVVTACSSGPAGSPSSPATMTASTTAPAYRVKVLLGDTDASALAVGPDGTIYFATNQLGARSGANGSLRYLPQGSAAAVDVAGSSGAAIAAAAVDPSGRLYIGRTDNSDPSKNAVYRYSEGHFLLIAGGGPSLEPHGQATGVQLQSPAGLAFFPDSQMAIAEHGGNQVVRVSVDGSIYPMVGTGHCVGGLEPRPTGPANQVDLCGPTSLTVDSDSNLYVAPRESDWILRVDKTGKAQVLASGLGRVSAVVAGSGGAIFVADIGTGRVLRILDGTITTVAEGLAAPRAMAVEPNGNLVVATEHGRQLLELASR